MRRPPSIELVHWAFLSLTLCAVSVRLPILRQLCSRANKFINPPPDIWRTCSATFMPSTFRRDHLISYMRMRPLSAETLQGPGPWQAQIAPTGPALKTPTTRIFTKRLDGHGQTHVHQLLLHWRLSGVNSGSSSYCPLPAIPNHVQQQSSFSPPRPPRPTPSSLSGRACYPHGPFSHPALHRST